MPQNVADVGEHLGRLVIEGCSHAGEKKIRFIPVYIKVVRSPFLNEGEGRGSLAYKQLQTQINREPGFLR